MPYSYEQTKTEIVGSESGINTLVRTVNKIKTLPSKFTAEEAFTYSDSWSMLASIDYLKEQGFIDEIEANGPFAQRRRFIRTRIIQ